MTKEQIVGFVQSEGGAVFRSAITRRFKNSFKTDAIEVALEEAAEAGSLFTFTVATAGPPAQVIAMPEFIRAQLPSQ